MNCNQNDGFCILYVQGEVILCLGIALFTEDGGMLKDGTSEKYVYCSVLY